MRIHLVTGVSGAGKTSMLRGALGALGSPLGGRLVVVSADAEALEGALPLDAGLVSIAAQVEPERLAELLAGLADATAYTDAFVEVPAVCDLAALTTALDLNLAHSVDGRVALAIGLWDARAPLPQNRARCRLADLVLINHTDGVDPADVPRATLNARELSRRAVVVPTLRGEVELESLIAPSAASRAQLFLTADATVAVRLTSPEPRRAAQRAREGGASRALLRNRLETLKSNNRVRVDALRLEAGADIVCDAEAVAALLESLPRGIFSARGTVWTAHGALSVFARTRFHSVSPTVARETRLCFQGVGFDPTALATTLIASARPTASSLKVAHDPHHRGPRGL